MWQSVVCLSGSLLRSGQHWALQLPSSLCQRMLTEPGLEPGQRTRIHLQDPVQMAQTPPGCSYPQAGRCSSSEDRPQSKSWARACSGVCRKTTITEQCRADCSSFTLASLRVLLCKLVRKLDINRLSSANKWFLPLSLSPPDQVTGSSQEPSELTHCSCTGMGNPQPRACQWKHPAINSQMSKSRNCN